MENINFPDDFKCSIPNKIEHFVYDPKLLSCGHSICTNCLLEVKNKTINCNRCNQLNESELIEQPVSTALKKFIDANCKDMSRDILTKIMDTEIKVKSK
jgi:hypothetical protein